MPGRFGICQRFEAEGSGPGRKRKDTTGWPLWLPTLHTKNVKDGHPAGGPHLKLVPPRVPQVSLLRPGVRCFHGQQANPVSANGGLPFHHFQLLPEASHLGSPATRNLFEQSLETIRRRYCFLVFGYVVMPEHVHLLVSEPKQAILSKAIQALKLSVAVRQRERPFWQARYYDFNVFTQRKHTEKLKYMHCNPVTRGLVKKPEEWPWSSFCHYLTGETGTVEIESRWTTTRRELASGKTHISNARCGAPSSVFELEK